MYDDLIPQLRELASIPAHCENVESCDGCSKENICLSFTNERIIEIASKAADAIEALSKRVDESIPKSDAEIIIEELSKPRWIPVTERLPSDFVSVQAHIIGAEPLPSVREAYVIGDKWFFPALHEFLLADYWREFDEPPKEET